MVRVGIVVSEKKLAQLSKRGLFQARGSVTYIVIGTAEDLVRERPEFLLTKMFPGIDRALLRAMTGVRQLCPLNKQEVFTDRWALIQTLQEAGHQVPSSVLVGKGSSRNRIEELVAECDGRVIVKPRTACGPTFSHDILITCSAVEIREFIQTNDDNEFVIQKYVNHDGVFFKVFVLGNHVSVFVRKSVSGTASGVLNTQGLFSDVVDTSIPPSLASQLERTARELIIVFQTQLLGIDVVVDESGTQFIVDVNFFPSYNELGDSFMVLLDKAVETLSVS